MECRGGPGARKRSRLDTNETGFCCALIPTKFPLPIEFTLCKDRTSLLRVRIISLDRGVVVRRSHFVCAVLVLLLGCWSLSFAETAKEFHDKGEAAYKAKDYAKAVEYYTEALKLEPDRHETIYARGVNYYNLKRYDDALADFNKIKDIKKIDHHALNYIGLVYNEKKDWYAAYKAFTEAVKLEPNSLLYCLNAARAAVTTDNRASAIAYYKEALKIDPTNKEAPKYINARMAAMEKSAEEHKTAIEQRELQEKVQEIRDRYRLHDGSMFPTPQSLTITRGGMVYRIPFITTLEAVFNYCIERKVPIKIAMNYLYEFGIKYERQDPGAGASLSQVLYRIAQRDKDLFSVAYDEKGRIHDYHIVHGR
jgi:tetratricopeptide (TPR) repeat protein